MEKLDLHKDVLEKEKKYAIQSLCNSTRIVQVMSINSWCLATQTLFLFDSFKKILVWVSWVVLVAGVGVWLNTLLDVSCFIGKRGVDEWILIQMMISEDCQVKSYSVQDNNSSALLRFLEKTISIIFQWKHQ